MHRRLQMRRSLAEHGHETAATPRSSSHLWPFVPLLGPFNFMACSDTTTTTAAAPALDTAIKRILEGGGGGEGLLLFIIWALAASPGFIVVGHKVVVVQQVSSLKTDRRPITPLVYTNFSLSLSLRRFEGSIQQGKNFCSSATHTH